jgi:GLPGLI family protein
MVCYLYEPARILAVQILIMKYLCTFLLTFLICLTAASQQTVNEAIIETIVNVTFPESDMPPAPEGAQVMRFGDGELKAKIFYKNGNSKIETDMGMGKSYTFYTAENKTTTTLMEMMGRKMGFYSNEEDIKKMMAADTNQKRIQAFKPEVFIEYLSDSKVIAGLTCYKAVIRYKTSKGEEKQQEVWYTPDFKMGEEFKLASVMRGDVPGLNKIKGFVMEMELVRQNGMKMHYKVAKIDLNAKIDDKTFVLPSGYDIKPQSEMMRGGNMQFRVGGSRD